MWLRPSYSSQEDMIALARRLSAAGESALNVIFHSSEIIPGGSPYNRTAADVDAFLGRLDRPHQTRRVSIRAVGADAEINHLLTGERKTPSARPVIRRIINRHPQIT